MEQNEDPYIVNSVDRALALIVLVSDKGSIGVHEAARHIGSAPSTAHRLLSTLGQRDFVTRGEDRRYYPGPQLLGARAEPRIPRLLRVVHPVLADLHRELNETVHLLVLTGQDIRTIAGIEANELLRVGVDIGKRVPAHTAAAGKAMLAELDPATVASIYPNGLPHWPGTAGMTLDDLMSELKTVRERHYGLNRDESQLGVSALGASISSVTTGILASISVALPTARFSMDTTTVMADALVRSCERATTLLDED